MRLSGALRTIAVVEAAKGALVLVAGLGLLSLVHHDAQRMAEALVAHSHLNPASRYPRIFLDFAAQVTDTRLMLAALGAATYAGLRFVEAYGLWRARSWAEWFAAIGGAIYLPFEAFEVYRTGSWMSVGVLLVNAAIVAVMLYGVRHPNHRGMIDR
jgi:uncharacterized membrane protein (DUF2068 family)